MTIAVMVIVPYCHWGRGEEALLLRGYQLEENVHTAALPHAHLAVPHASSSNDRLLPSTPFFPRRNPREESAKEANECPAILFASLFLAIVAAVASFPCCRYPRQYYPGP